MENKSIKWPLDTQTIRLIDVFAIGPFMIYVGTKKELSNEVRLTLWGLGLATILYNGINYLNNKK